MTWFLVEAGPLDVEVLEVLDLLVALRQQAVQPTNHTKYKILSILIIIKKYGSYRCVYLMFT